MVRDTASYQPIELLVHYLVCTTTKHNCSSTTRINTSSMAGLGRRSHYRKHLTDAVINDLPVPNFEQGERIAKVLASRGGNLLEIDVASAPPHFHDRTGTTPQLALLPTKFRKLVWVKRGDYLIVTGDDQADEHEGCENIKVRYMVKNILYKDQVKHLRGLDGGVWPERFVDEDQHKQQQRLEEDELAKQLLLNNRQQEDRGTDTSNDQDEEQDYYTSEEDNLDQDPNFFVNTNRIAKLTVESDSSDEDE